MYLIRLDDASEYMDVEKWDRLEAILDCYNVKPLVGIIPNNQDESMVKKYSRDPAFWRKAVAWQAKNWTIALHGYTHVYCTNDQGINPVNFQSEFAGIPLEEQRKKISCGIRLLEQHKLDAKVFFAPSHTFDLNTLEALKEESKIRIISDTVANDIYKLGEFYFIPLQSGYVRRLPFKLTTFCYHPNTMNELAFNVLEDFLKKNTSKITGVQDLTFKERKMNIYDHFLRRLYFGIRNTRRLSNIIRHQENLQSYAVIQVDDFDKKG